MKKLLTAGIIAMALVVSTQQQASAWCKWNFSAGVSLSYEGGNNNLMWGLLRNGQVPGYPTDVYQGHYAMQNFVPNTAFPGYGAAPGYGGYPAMDGGAIPYPQPLPAPTPTPAPKAETTQAIYYSNMNQQQSGYYQYPQMNYYQAPAYGYSPYGYGSYQVPSYWYGN